MLTSAGDALPLTVPFMIPVIGAVYRGDWSFSGVFKRAATRPSFCHRVNSTRGLRQSGPVTTEKARLDHRVELGDSADAYYHTDLEACGEEPRRQPDAGTRRLRQLIPNADILVA